MNGKIVTLIIILVILGVAGGYYLGTNYKFTLQPQNAVTTTAPVSPWKPQPVDEQPGSGTESSAPAASPTADETALLTTAVRAGLVAKHGPDAASLNVTVSKIQGNFAQGGASGQGGGGMWFAAKVGGVWTLVWDGNGTISCASISPYNFPSAMIPECFDEAAQKIVTR